MSAHRNGVICQKKHMLESKTVLWEDRHLAITIPKRGLYIISPAQYYGNVKNNKIDHNVMHYSQYIQH